jgi:hypothetical protein
VLFGISTPGALGQRNELRDAFELFSKTYVSDRQQVIEEIITKFRNLQGEVGDFNIQPIEPLRYEFSENIISQNLTQNEIREIMGKEPLNSGDVTADGVKALPESAPIQQSNEAIKNLSGRQYQNVMRIVRQFGNGKLTKQQASLMLKNGFGFTDEDVNTFLGIDDSPLTDDEVQKFSENPEVSLLQAFSEIGETKDLFNVIMSTPMSHFENFADDFQLNQLQANILDLYKKDGKITPDVIATTLKKPLDEVKTAIDELIKNKIISTKQVKSGSDNVTQTKILKTPSQLPGKDSKVTQVLVRYSYEWRVPVDEQDYDTSRPFCQKLMDLDRLYTRQEIENLSQRLGYSVWDRCGGFWNNNGKIEYKCRHTWMANIVTRKK